MFPPALAIQQANDATPGTVPRITAPGQVLVSNVGGTGAAWVPSSSIGGGGGGGSSGAVTLAIVTVVTANVASLAAGPLANDGYTILTGDVLALALQTTPTNNRLYTASVAGSVVTLTTLVTQPPSETLLRVTQGTQAQSLWVYSTSVIALVPASAGTLTGTYTTTQFAPDGLGMTMIGNESVPRQSIASDGAFHDVWSYDMVGRVTTSGRLRMIASAMPNDGAKTFSLDLRAAILLSATPTAGAVPASSALDETDEDGSGPYADMRFFVTGTAVKLQIKNLQGSAVNFTGIVSFYRITT